MDVDRMLSDDLRKLCLEAVAEDPEVMKRKIAAGRRVPLDSVDKMLTKDRWDLALALGVMKDLRIVPLMSGWAKVI